jgi:hypothetical protein
VSAVCAECGDLPGAFFCTVAGVHVRLCADCAGRLMEGEPKGDVIRSINEKKEAA